ncbi:Asp23/Gls24 family envelope stress response protein [Amycolatopsis antarctica]|uniref:Asp23/Gls24 family envelope stress response protein n=1 Tax=Amycolatopsis antarctica TaxID=1854586 RepID=UPI001F0A8FEE|nr:Asp23/Gls24 family envelope stress response protein [Amycolatopsis antarctica]
MTGPTIEHDGSGTSTGRGDDGRGGLTIADTVVRKVAGIAARDVPGVFGLGGGGTRTVGAIRDRISGDSSSAGGGVSVDVGEKQVAVDLRLVVDYGSSIVDVSRAVRRDVIGAVESITGLTVVEVNINVDGVHFAEEDGDEQVEDSRVR